MPQCERNGCQNPMECSAYYQNPKDVIGFCRSCAVHEFMSKKAYKIEEGLP